MQTVSKSRLRAFARAYLRTMDPARAAREIGTGDDGMRLLEDERTAEEIRRARELLAKQFTPEDTVRRMVELAFGRANDCVRLALEERPPIDALDLSHRPDQRIHEVVDEILELLMDLDATDEQLDSPMLFCSGRNGTASYSPDVEGTD